MSGRTTNAKERSGPDLDDEAEKDFLKKRVAPVLAAPDPPISYLFDVKPGVELPSNAGRSIKVTQARPVKEFDRRQGTQKASGVTPKYYIGPAKKTRRLICLHFTAGGFLGSLGALVRDGRRTGVPYLIGRSGTIYELHDDGLWGWSSSTHRNEETIAIELVNVGPLRKYADGYFAVSDIAPRGKYYCSLAEGDELVDHLPAKYRGHEYFAKFTKEQYDSLTELLLYLTDKYRIPFEFLEAPDPRDPNAKRYSFGKPRKARPKDVHDWTGWEHFSGIVSHVNFHEKGRTENMPGEKWDIGPAFEWERLKARSLSLPVDIRKLGGAPKPGEELHVTRVNLDCLFKHTEGDTAKLGGSYPLGNNTFWHGGVHLFVEGVDVHACIDGQVVAARLATPQIPGSQRPDNYGSGAFILVRHELSGQLIAQLESLLKPVSYTVTRLSEVAPGVKFEPERPFTDPKFTFEPGDVFIRTDDPDARRPRSLPNISYPVEVKVSSLVETVEHVLGFDVVGVKKAGDHSPVLVLAERVAGPSQVFERGEPFPLVRGDHLKLADVSSHSDLRRRELKKEDRYEVVLEALADDVADVLTYEVVTPWYLAFRKSSEDPPPPDPEPSPDNQRHPDLCEGDILSVLQQDIDQADVGGHEAPRMVAVEVKSLASDSKDLAYIEINKGNGRTLLATAERGADQLLKLEKGDELELVQREARASEKARWDLVKLARLAEEPEVPDEDSTGIARRRCSLVKEPGSRKVVGRIEQGKELVVVSASRYPWLLVTSEDNSGWMLYNKRAVDLTVVPRSAANWTKKFLNEVVYVASFSNAELKKAKQASGRALTEGTKGFVRVPSSALKAGGTKRKEKYGYMLNARGSVAFNPDLLNPTGTSRGTKYPFSNEIRGQLTFNTQLLAESRTVRSQLERLKGKPFYSLYMHLDDKLIEAGDLAAAIEGFRWFPREVSRLKLKQPTTWRSAQGEEVDLIPGDELVLEPPWLTEAVPSKVRWDVIVGELITTIGVKDGTKYPVWLRESPNGAKVAPLMPGDRLEPKVRIASYPKNTWVEVRVIQSHPRQIRRVTEGPRKILHLMDDKGHVRVGSVKRGELVRELGTHGARTCVKVDRTAAQGWVATKDLGKVVGIRVINRIEGWILWSDAAFDAIKQSRSDIYRKHKGKLGGVVPNILLEPSFAERVEGPSSEHIARLKRAEVVGFPLVESGRDASTRVRAGDPLWKSGKFAPVLPRDEAMGAYGSLLHWEIFSEENLLPSRPFRRDDRQLWSDIGWPWREVVDSDPDWTMDCKENLMRVAKGIPEGDADEKIVDEILNPQEVASLYAQAEVAKRLRYAACNFMLEWAVDPRVGLRKMKNSELDKAWWSRFKQMFARGSVHDWTENVDAEWIDRQSRYIAPVLWWNDATRALGARSGTLPTNRVVWHYNPIAFLEAFSALDLARAERR
jgi:N-acetyl-anhydromuramyl-L-alanine amidase AmpD